MGKNSKIEWCHHTFNPWTGCTKVSPGCEHCYAESWAKRTGIVKWGPSGIRKVTSDANWRNPLVWDREAAATGQRKRVFCASLSDVFEDRPELDNPRKRLWGLIESTPNLDWLLLTKRPENILPLLRRIKRFNHPAMGEVYTADRWLSDPHLGRNIWIGCTVEDQVRADQRIPYLLKVPAVVRFLSIEPMLGPIDLSRSSPCGYYCDSDIGHVDHPFQVFQGRCNGGGISWVICGGESGPKARPMHPAWVRSLRDQCQEAGIPFFFKQWGRFVPPDQIDGAKGRRLVFVDARSGSATPALSPYEPGCPCDHRPSEAEMVDVGKKVAGRLLDGRTWDEFPQTDLVPEE